MAGNSVAHVNYFHCIFGALLGLFHTATAEFSVVTGARFTSVTELQEVAKVSAARFASLMDGARNCLGSAARNGGGGG